MGILGIALSLAGLMYFAYRGINVLVLAPIMALFAALFHADVGLLETYTEVFMPALGNYLLKYFPIFMLGSIFGKLMSDSGAAATIAQNIAKCIGAQRAILAVVCACAILTYGGVSLFVVAFCIFPIAVSLFRQADIPKRLIPGAIALGSFTFTMTALPGTPAIQNAIPMPYFGTTAFAAPGLGLIGALIMFMGGWLWLSHRAAAAKTKGEGYLSFNQTDLHEENKQTLDEVLPGLMSSLVPLVAVLAINFVCSQYIIPEWSTGRAELKSVLGLWSLIIALTVGLIILLFLMRKSLKNWVSSINEGTMGSLLPIFNTASEVGYGACIASFASFVIVKDAVLGIAPKYPLISEAISINVLAGITGSASGGLSIALEALSANYLEMADAVGLSPELLHRVASMSCGGFDTLPHNGAVITLLGICGLTHKTSYFDVFIVAVIVPFFSTATVVLVGSLFGSF